MEKIELELISKNYDSFLKDITKANKVRVKIFGNKKDLPKITQNIITNKCRFNLIDFQRILKTTCLRHLS